MKLEFQNIDAAYGNRLVLNNVSFSVESGSITALLGRNGAGKTTLLRRLMGEKTGRRGSILLDGQDVRPMAPAARAKLLSCLPQQLPSPRVNVRELVAFGRAPHVPLSGRLCEADREAVKWALDAVGMTAMADALVDSLSGGERKKAFFAMTLAQETPVVVMDEPTAHLDAASRFAFLELVDKLRRETGRTFLVVMHELSEVLRFADRLVVIHDGTVAFDGTPETCLEAGIPQRCFDIRITGNRETGYAVLPQ